MILVFTCILTWSCSENVNKEIDINDYYETQGVITKVNPAIVKGQRHLSSYYFTYIDTDSTMKHGTEKYIETRMRVGKGSPVTIMIHKEDSLDMFIDRLGVFYENAWSILQKNLEKTSD